MQSRVSKKDKISAYLLSALILLPASFMIIANVEYWPYSSGPMFAHYADKNIPLYRFVFALENEQGERILDLNRIGIKERMFQRYFFGKVYGSIDPSSPHGHHPKDNLKKFKQRMETFFPNFLNLLDEYSVHRSDQIKKIKLYAIRLQSEQNDYQKRLIGYYTPASASYTQSWSQP